MPKTNSIRNVGDQWWLVNSFKTDSGFKIGYRASHQSRGVAGGRDLALFSA